MNFIALLVWAVIGMFFGGIGGAIVGIIIYLVIVFVVLPFCELVIDKLT